MKILFIDTEFADFINTEMISLGIVSVDGEDEFYVELKDFRPQVCSEFTRMNVIPHLDLQKHGKSRTEAAARLYCWLEELEEECVICPDNKIDWEIFIDLIEDLPANIQKQPMLMWPALRLAVMAKADELQTPDYKWFFETGMQQFTEGFTEYFLRNPSPKQHHALADSKANRTGWIKVHKWMDSHGY